MGYLILLILPFFLRLYHISLPPRPLTHTAAHSSQLTAHTHQQLLGFRKDSISAMFAWLVTRGGSKGVGAS